MNLAQNIETRRDGIETAILLALTARNKGRHKAKKTGRDKAGFYMAEVGLERFCPSKAEFPKRMLAFDMRDADRLYTDSLDGLVVPPRAAIGHRLEAGLLCEDGTLKWSLIKPMPAPRGLVAVTNQKVEWFAYHYREIQEGQPDVYVRRPMPLAGGRVPMMKALGLHGLDPRREKEELEEQLALTLSIFEDAHRIGAILATVEEAVGLTFPVGEDAYKSFFALRDGLRETPTGRRNPILHWCQEHMRRTWSGHTKVTGHDRGKAELIHGNIRLTLERSEGYASLLEQNRTRT